MRGTCSIAKTIYSYMLLLNTPAVMGWDLSPRVTPKPSEKSLLGGGERPEPFKGASVRISTEHKAFESRCGHRLVIEDEVSVRPSVGRCSEKVDEHL